MKFELRLNQKTPSDWLSKENSLPSLHAVQRSRATESIHAAAPAPALQRSMVSFYRQELSPIRSTPFRPQLASQADARSPAHNRSAELSAHAPLHRSLRLDASSFARGAPTALNALTEAAPADPRLLPATRQRFRAKLLRMKAVFFLLFLALQLLLYRLLRGCERWGGGAEGGEPPASGLLAWAPPPALLAWAKYAVASGLAVALALQLVFASSLFQYDRLEVVKALARLEPLPLLALPLSLYLHHIALDQLERLLGARAALHELVALFLARCIAEARVSAGFWLRRERRALAHLLELNLRGAGRTLRAELRAALGWALLAVGAALALFHAQRLGDDPAADGPAAADFLRPQLLLRAWLLLAVHCAGFETLLELFGVLARLDLRSYFGAGRSAQAVLGLLAAAADEGAPDVFERCKWERDCLRFLDRNLAALHEFNFALEGRPAAVRRAQANWRLLLEALHRPLRLLQESFQPGCEKDFEAPRDFLDWLFSPRRALLAPGPERRRFLRSYAQLRNLGLKLDVLKQLLMLTANPAMLGVDLDEMRVFVSSAERLARDIGEFFKAAREGFWSPALRAEYAHAKALLEDFAEKAYPPLFNTQFRPQRAF